MKAVLPGGSMRVMENSIRKKSSSMKEPLSKVREKVLEKPMMKMVFSSMREIFRQTAITERENCTIPKKRYLSMKAGL